MTDTKPVSDERLAQLLDFATRLEFDEYVSVYSELQNYRASRHQEPVEPAERQVEITDAMIIAGLEVWPRPWEEYKPGDVLRKAFAAALRAASIPKVEPGAMAASLMRITAIVEGLYGFLDLGPNSPEGLKENWTAWCKEKARAWEAANAALSPATSEGEAVFISRAFDPMTAGGFEAAASQPTPVSPLPVRVTTWECKDYAGGWVRFHSLDAALDYQYRTGCVMRPIRDALSPKPGEE